MHKVKDTIKKIIKLLKTLIKYGPKSCRKLFYHVFNKKSISLEEIQKCHLISKNELNEQRHYEFKRNIKFSIITPLYNTPENFLKELLYSLQQQTYFNWELCLADGSDSEHTYVGKICKQYASQDSRFKYSKLNENKGISENTNECIKLATGDYYGLLDHDDILHSSALFEVAKVIEEQNADFIYTDEVKFSGDIKNISNPLMFNFKPGFGVEDLRSHNYICHFTVFDKKLLENESQMFRPEFDGSQDHDMVLRLTEKASKIVHIDKVLYYWRVHANSVSMDLDSKSYAVDAAIRAVDSQLKRMNEKGTVASSAPFRTLYKVNYELSEIPLVSIVVHSGKNKKSILKTIQKIKELTNYSNYEIVCVSNESIVEEGVQLVKYSGNLPEQLNAAIENSHGQHVILLEGNVMNLTNTWIEELLMYSQKEKIGVVGAKVYSRDSSIVSAGISLDIDQPNKLYQFCLNDYLFDIGYEAMLCHIRNTTSNNMNCMMFRKSLWKEIGGFENSLPDYLDIDFCLKAIKSGYRNIWCPYSEIFLRNSTVRSFSDTQVSLFMNTWNEYILKDNHFNKAWKILKLV